MCRTYLIVAAIGIAACGAPKTRGEQRRLDDQAEAALQAMEAKDAGISRRLREAYAYAVFPDIGKAGLLYVGGAYGNGILYEHGRPSGVVQLRQGSAGLELGGQTYAELVLLQDQGDVERLKDGKFDLGGDISAVVLKSGAAAAATFRDGVAVFVMPRGGLMAGVTVTGQSIEYHPWVAGR